MGCALLNWLDGLAVADVLVSEVLAYIIGDVLGQLLAIHHQSLCQLLDIINVLYLRVDELADCPEHEVSACFLQEGGLD